LAFFVASACFLGVQEGGDDADVALASRLPEVLLDFDRLLDQLFIKVKSVRQQLK